MTGYILRITTYVLSTLTVPGLQGLLGSGKLAKEVAGGLTGIHGKDEVRVCLAVAHQN